MQLRNSRYLRRTLLAATVAAISTPIGSVHADDSTTTKDVTIIHMGDIHGHLYPRPNVRSDSVGRMEGGLARMKTRIDKIRSEKPYNLLVNTGDTIQGSGEALYTRGKALTDVLDLFKIDVFAPGNWDFVYGKDRFVELFSATTYPATTTTAKRWGAVAANVYHAGVSPSATILPPTKFKSINGLKIGIIGCTTNRGPQAVGTWVTDGLTYTDCSAEVKTQAAAFRSSTRPSSGTGDPGGAVDLVILASEIEIGRNIQLLKELTIDNHVDIVLNSDMHEEVSKPLSVTTAATLKSLIVEQGMDGTALGQINLKIDRKKPVGFKIVSSTYTQHRIDDSLAENSTVKSKVTSVSTPYLQAGYVKPTTCDATSKYWNMFSETCLHGPLDAHVGIADAALHRSNFDDELYPAALEGSSHNWIADAIRWWAGSDAATVRGFRYGTTVKAGSKIKRNDLFHFVPIGPRVAKVSRITATQLRNQIDNSSRSTFGSDPAIDWRGGWLFGYSADDFSLKFDPYSVSTTTNPVDWNATNGNQYYNPANPSYGGVDPFAAFRKVSRARDLTVRVPCAGLPAAEQAGCVGSAVTHVTNNTDGDWSPAWGTAFPASTIYNLAPGNASSDGAAYTPWKLTTVSTITRPFQMPAMSAAGYWYRKTPQTLNNCENCFPSGISNAKALSPTTPYLLPVNADANGNPMLDSSGIPVVVVYTQTDADAGLIPAGYQVGDWVPDTSTTNNNLGKPQALGRAIDLVEILEKYLKTRNANPSMNRVTLWNGATLPGRTVFGYPVIQPLCGTLGRTPSSACP